MEERDDDFYFEFKNEWHRISEYAPKDMEVEILGHRGVLPKRQSISQTEFESICKIVLLKYPDIKEIWFEELGIIHIIFPSHSGKSNSGASLYFGEKGYITYDDWKYNSERNDGKFMGEDISKGIHNALYGLRP